MRSVRSLLLLLLLPIAIAGSVLSLDMYVYGLYVGEIDVGRFSLVAMRPFWLVGFISRLVMFMVSFWCGFTGFELLVTRIELDDEMLNATLEDGEMFEVWVCCCCDDCDCNGDSCIWAFLYANPSTFNC